MSERVPPPGSQEAVDEGCICGIAENTGGRGIDGKGEEYVLVNECPLHGPHLFPDLTGDRLEGAVKIWSREPAGQLDD